jgi:3-deoxy-manno-octulosonate cytidylyltransferase (CMP-KDO synthetase)
VLLFDVRPAGCSVSAHDTSQTHIHTVAVIPARYASTRLPGKPLVDLAGRPMIEHVCRRASASHTVGAVIVATDDTRIADAVRRFGGVPRLTSPAHFSATDRVAEVAADLDCDLVVNVQGDEPLISSDAIDAAVQPFASDATLQMSTLCCRFSNPDELADPGATKVVLGRDGFALYFSRCPIPFQGNGARGNTGKTSAEAGPFKHIGLYVYRRDFLLRLAALPPSPLEVCESLEQLRALENGFAIKVVETSHDSIGVNTPQDLERVRQLMAAETRA